MPGRGRGALFPCLAMAAAPDRAEIDKSVDCCGRGVSGRSGIPWGAAGIPWDFFGGCPGAWVQGSGASHRSALSGSGPADMLRAAHALAPCQPDGCSCGRLARKTRPKGPCEKFVRTCREMESPVEGECASLRFGPLMRFALPVQPHALHASWPWRRRRPPPAMKPWARDRLAMPFASTIAGPGSFVLPDGEPVMGAVLSCLQVAGSVSCIQRRGQRGPSQARPPPDARGRFEASCRTEHRVRQSMRHRSKPARLPAAQALRWETQDKGVLRELSSAGKAWLWPCELPAAGRRAPMLRAGPGSRSRTEQKRSAQGTKEKKVWATRIT